MEIHGRGDGVGEDRLGGEGVWRSMGGGWGKNVLLVRECQDPWEARVCEIVVVKECEWEGVMCWGSWW